MKTFIELDWLPMAALQATAASAGLQRWMFSQMQSI